MTFREVINVLFEDYSSIQASFLYYLIAKVFFQLKEDSFITYGNKH